MYPNGHHTSVPQTWPPTWPPPGQNRNTPGQPHNQHQHPKNTASTTPRITDNYPHHHQQRNPAAFFGLTLGCPCWVGGSDSGLLRPCLPGACCPRVMPAFACGQSCLHRGVLRLVPGWLWLKSSRLVPWRGRVGTAYPWWGFRCAKFPALPGGDSGLSRTVVDGGVRTHTPVGCSCAVAHANGGRCRACDWVVLWLRESHSFWWLVFAVRRRRRLWKGAETVAGVAPGFHADDGLVGRVCCGCVVGFSTRVSSGGCAGGCPLGGLWFGGCASSAGLGHWGLLPKRWLRLGRARPRAPRARPIWVGDPGGLPTGGARPRLPLGFPPTVSP